ncbi:filamentous hemagglutinin N-terminal domain-containing protein [Novosphingobium sp.]|uniref:two-partner secretion domain-containing protein n=1 Tax=Novosphingobium sp. TaxID=1874826 RepID=UPI003BAB8744
MRLLLLALAALAASPAWAQQTAIVPDTAGSALAAGTTVTSANHVSTIDGGTLAGTNLFHSFTTFNLASGDTARWTTTLTDPARVTNVINRVTGGTVSQINGTVDSTGLPNAAFFFINPAGIVFGKEASVNVPGAAWFSTGKQLRFADGAMLSATTATGSTFSVAAPQSFGFLGQEGDIALQGTTALLASPKSAVGLVGANLRIEGARISASRMTLVAPGEQAADIALEGAGDGGVLSGEITLAGSNLASAGGSQGAAILRGGGIALDNTVIATTGGAMISIDAANLDVRGGSVIIASDMGSSNAGNIAISAGDLALSDKSIVRSVTNGGANAGEVTVQAATLQMHGDSEISSLTFSSGNAGMVRIEVGSADLDGFAHINSDSSAELACADLSCVATGDAGDISVKANALRMRDNSSIETGTLGAGHAGKLGIDVIEVELFDDASISSNSYLPPFCNVSSCAATGDAGAVNITASALRMYDYAGVQSETYGAGHAGTLTINAQEVELAGSAYITSDSTGPVSCNDRSCAASGDAGDVSITADTLGMRDYTALTSDTKGSGRAGTLTINVHTADLSGSAYISSDSTGPESCNDRSCAASGDAGEVSITANTLRMRENASVSSDTFGSGHAGTLTINADTAALSGSASISSSSTSTDSCLDPSCKATGDAGDLRITAGTLILRDASSLASDTNGVGSAGKLIVSAKSIDMAGSAGMTSNSKGSCSDQSCAATGDAGDITITTDSFTMRENAGVSSYTFGSGKAGKLSITGKTIGLSGAAFISTSSTGPSSCADMSCLGSGNAGDISIQSDTLTLRDDSSVTSNTLSSGHAGSIVIKAQTAIMAGSATISSDATRCALCDGLSSGPAGDAGDITILANDLRMSDDAGISSDTLGDGHAGSITIKAQTTLLSGFAYVSSDSTGADSCIEASCFARGDAGTISIESNRLTMTDTPSISSATLGPGRAGDIRISAQMAEILGGDIFTSSFACGDGTCLATGSAGTVTFKAGTMVIDHGATISSETGFTGSAGDISIQADTLRLLDGKISSQTSGCGNGTCIGGTSGQITISANALALSGPSQITTSSASQAVAGSIIIGAPDISITGPASISSSNTGTELAEQPMLASPANSVPFGAGSVALTTTYLSVADGGSVTTNSASGPAGSIIVTIPQARGILQLVGAHDPGVITTSSGPGTGGVITISDPLAIISNGGSILAKGQAGGADVRIASEYFIQSADRPNVISVDGSIRLQSNIYDVSAGTAPPSLDFLDASRVLLGQCASARATGETSRISWRNTGPYAFLPVRGAALAFLASGMLEGPAC